MNETQINNTNEITVIDVEAGHRFEIHACGCRDIERTRDRHQKRNFTNECLTWNKPAGTSLIEILTEAGWDAFARDNDFDDVETYVLDIVGDKWATSLFKVHNCAKGMVK